MGRLILFGATGDLARRKLFPSLVEVGGSLPIIAVGRRSYTNSNFAEHHLPEDELFRARVTYRKMDFTDKQGYESLLDSEGGNFIYLSVDPTAVPEIVRQLQQLHLPQKSSFLQIVIEKPFGTNQPSAIKLEEVLENVFSPEQLLRVDHYLLKEGVLLAKTLVSQNNQFQQSNLATISVKILESEGIGTRGNFYHQTGAIRDIVQNHALNVAIMVMAGTVSTSVFESLHVQDAIFGQYEGFTDEADVPEDSTTETYARVSLLLGAIHVMIETGKALDQHLAEIKLETHDRQTLVVHIQPDVSFIFSKHGEGIRYCVENLGADAYTRLFKRLFNGTLLEFTLDPRSIQAAWGIADQLVERASREKPILYPVASPGPA